MKVVASRDVDRVLVPFLKTFNKTANISKMDSVKVCFD